MSRDPRAQTQSEPVPGRPGVGIAPSWEKWAAAAALVFVIAFGWVVLDRSAFSDRRRTDAGVFFRAGWAALAGVDPYRVTDENDLFYLYPPGMAAFMAPLADPPAGEPLPPGKDWWRPGTPERALHGVPGYLPYEWSIVIWYALSVLCAALSVHAMARALELSSSRPEIRATSPRFGGWWNLRFWPLLAVLPDVGSTLSKGQVNLIMLACIASGCWLIASGRRAWGGALWALAACIKVFPGLLLFELLARRDGRGIRGYVLCGVACMIVLPLVVFGPSRAVDYTWTFLQHVLLAGLGLADVATLQSGSGPENTDNASIQGVLHNVLNIATPRGQRPEAIEGWTKLVHAGVSLALLGATLLVGRARTLASSPRAWLNFADEPVLAMCLRTGMLCCVMLAAVPMCHRHYFVFMFPGIACLVFISMQRSTLALPSGSTLALVIGAPVLLGVAKIEQQGLLRDLPLHQGINMVVWGSCFAALRRLCDARASAGSRHA